MQSFKPIYLLISKLRTGVDTSPSPASKGVGKIPLREKVKSMEIVERTIVGALLMAR